MSRIKGESKSVGHRPRLRSIRGPGNELGTSKADIVLPDDSLSLTQAILAVQSIAGFRQSAFWFRWRRRASQIVAIWHDLAELLGKCDDDALRSADVG